MAARGCSLGASIYGDPYQRPLQALQRERAKLGNGSLTSREVRGIRGSITYWRQVLTVSVAQLRADAGDRAAARRLAWRADVLKHRQRAQWLVERATALDREVARIVRHGPPCDACRGRLDRARATLGEFLAEIAALPEATPPSYVEYARRELASACDAEAWLRRQLEGLGKAGA